MTTAPVRAYGIGTTVRLPYEKATRSNAHLEPCMGKIDCQRLQGGSLFTHGSCWRPWQLLDLACSDSWRRGTPMADGRKAQGRLRLPDEAGSGTPPRPAPLR